MLTDAICKGFGLFLPRHSKEVNRNAAERDDHAHETLEGTAEERHDDEEDRDEDEEDREEEIHLKESYSVDMHVRGGKIIITTTYFYRPCELGARVAHVDETSDWDSEKTTLDKSRVVEEHVEVAWRQHQQREDALPSKIRSQWNKPTESAGSTGMLPGILETASESRNWRWCKKGLEVGDRCARPRKIICNK